ncbi:IS5 family transposase [Lacticaseibacillus paracasei]|uniref:IS5 family transposase n=1 Tax=Lacticaseibacillus paracasei TaxID=1597 RepID=UPI001F5138EB|nr:IS5 family transposase [Lacticaseibacillus paracasei]MCI0374418.1 IS5 family transposase [Lacticaseibacillus paracasei]MCI0374421.1 IS5 family transposase [Lacticaseibacillus paracasei]MCI0375363.1 IS5 family transposase [Lacticaseibacillus paracasei]
MPDYPSNLTKEQFEFIRPDLESFRKRTHPRTVALYDVFNAVIYVLRTGSQWRQLPNDFPKWQTVYDYFRMWSRPLPHSEDSLLDLLLKKPVARDRLQLGRSVRTSFVILDAQSVKNTEPAEHKGYDGGKKIAGIKRHLAVDINGLPIAIHITTANVSERDGGVALLSLNDGQFELVQRIMADGGYTGDDFAQSVRSVIGADVIIAKQSDLKNGYVTPQRWIVERTFSWLEKWRRLWFNCERQLHTSQMMVTLAFVTILLRRH